MELTNLTIAKSIQIVWKNAIILIKFIEVINY